MSYRIGQDFSYSGNDYWRWWAWIDGDEPELDNIVEVTWLLHPSFSQSRRVTKERGTKFRLETSGWGTFLLRAELALRDGDKRLLKHNLRLEYPENLTAVAPEKMVATPSNEPTVYLSYSTEDLKVAAELRAGLGTAGFEVLDQSRLSAGAPLSESLQRMIAQADILLALIGGEEISPWVSFEIKAAVASSKPTLVLVPSGASISGLPPDIQTHTVDLKRIDPAEIANLLRSSATE